MKPHHIFILLLVLLAGCSSTGSLTSFGNRKYTKGYFLDNPVETKSKIEVNAKTKEPTIRLEPKVENKISLNTNIKVTREPIKAIILIKKTQLTGKVINVAIGSVSKVEHITQSPLLPDDPQPEVDEKTGKPINWGVSAFICGFFCLLAGILALVALNDFAGISILLFVAVALISGIIAVLTALHAIHVNDSHILFAKIALGLCTISAILLLLLL